MSLEFGTTRLIWFPRALRLRGDTPDLGPGSMTQTVRPVRRLERLAAASEKSDAGSGERKFA